MCLMVGAKGTVRVRDGSMFVGFLMHILYTHTAARWNLPTYLPRHKVTRVWYIYISF